MVTSVSPNAQQLRAIKHPRGPLLIIAGAGTGKTTVITERIKYLIQVKKVSPQNILAVTFTDKAAQEMLERLDVVMPLGYQEPWLSTFHAFGDRLLRAHGLEIGLDPDYQILTPPEQWIFVKQHLFEFALSHYRPLGNPTKFIAALLTLFSRAQDEAVTPEELIEYATNLSRSATTPADTETAEKLLEVARAYHTYQQLKFKHSVLDFGDLITQTLNLFTTRPSILRNYQDQFQHILVDEFQDTNYTQYQLIKLLAPASQSPNLVVVADDDQAIYRWRGAAVSNVLTFQDNYPKAKIIILIKNYRSFQPILNTAYKVIQNNNPDRLEIKLKLNKKLTPIRRQPRPPTPPIINLPTEIDETEWITQKILELVAKHNYTYKDFAILARANSQLDPFVTTFRRHGLPYQLVGNRGLFDQPQVRHLLFFLKVLVNPHDSISLFQLLHTDIFHLSPRLILDLVHQAKLTRVSLWDKLQTQPQPEIKNLIELITSSQARLPHDPPTKIIYAFLSQTQYVKDLVQSDTLDTQLKLQNLNLFLNFLKSLETDFKDTTTIELVDYLDLLIEAGANPAQAEIEDIDTIRLITVHSAKGLEFPVVFIPSLVAGRFPAINRRDPIEFPDALIKETLPTGDSYLQEERRLFYVGLTRARDYLFLTWAQDYGGAQSRRPSGFLAETHLKTKNVTTSPQLALLTAPLKSPQVIPLAHGQVVLKSVSFSQIDTFKACPLKYKYRYVLQVPAAPHHALSFGQSLHDTLRHFHQLQQLGQKLTLKKLLQLYHHYFREEGYDSSQHKQERFQTGAKALRHYFKVYRSHFGHPQSLEKSFCLNIAGVPLVGKIDRIDKVGNNYEIIDYKTGQSLTKKDVDKDEQLSIYALAAKEALGFTPQALSLYFIELNQKLSTHRSAKDLEDTFDRLKKRIAEIRTSDFPATPGSPFPCHFCEYNTICPFAAKKR